MTLYPYLLHDDPQKNIIKRELSIIYNYENAYHYNVFKIFYLFIFLVSLSNISHLDSVHIQESQ